VNYQLIRTLAPISEPITLAQALLQCHQNLGVEDSWFEDRIKSGREFIETYTKRSLLTQRWKIIFDNNAPSIISLPRSPVQSIYSVKVDDVDIFGNIFPLREGIPARVEIGKGYSGGKLEIEYMAGYGDTSESVPSPLIDAILLYVSYSYENRAGEGNIPSAFYDLIEPYRLHL